MKIYKILIKRLKEYKSYQYLNEGYYMGQKMKSYSFISAGSNMGDSLLNCREGINKLANSEGVRLIQISRFYKTEPLHYREQDWFVNAVVKISTNLAPYQLLELLQSIQRDAGRIKDKVRFGPRILDLDIILYDDLIINSAHLTIPHLQMHKRRFVLKPLCDIAPKLIHPILNVDMQTLLIDLEPKEQKVKVL